MPRFIDLHIKTMTNGKRFVANVNTRSIICMMRDESEGYTRVYLGESEEFFIDVVETVEEILLKIQEA